MDSESKLKEALGALLDLAAAQNGVISIYDVWDACDGLDLVGEQIDLVCAYLEMNHVNIDGYQASEENLGMFRDALTGAEEASQQEAPKKSSSPFAAGPDKDLTGEESSYYKMYLEELRQAASYPEEEEDALVAAMLEGDERARDLLFEGNLRRVVKIAKNYFGRGVLAADLVQEGNMALFLAMATYEPGENFGRYVTREVESALNAAVREQTGADDISLTVAAEANALMKATEELADELGREATAEELAAHLHMSKDRVETLVKMSLDAMNLPTAEGADEVDQTQSKG